jgi:hypothetical protein
MSTNQYDIGDEVRCTGTFTDESGTAQDPASVAFRFKAPSATTATAYVYGTDAEVVKDSTGVYHVDLDITEAGTWYTRWSATGVGQAAGEGQFYVIESNVI